MVAHFVDDKVKESTFLRARFGENNQLPTKVNH